jgi:cyclopropane fatty-acyl-phospholipid synthase-like methyltransferase
VSAGRAAPRVDASVTAAVSAVMPARPFAPACERNRDPILAVLREHLGAAGSVLEIGSGTGQHAVHFAAALPHLIWQASERAEHLPGIRLWLDEAGLPNTPPPIALDVGGAWPARRHDAVFSANTLHIMAWEEVQRLFAALPGALAPRGTLVVYGPFNYGGAYTSPSNAQFDQWLRSRGAHQGIRDFAAVDALARGAGLALVEDRALPANNRCVVWRAATV